MEIGISWIWFWVQEWDYDAECEKLGYVYKHDKDMTMHDESDIMIVFACTEERVCEPDSLFIWEGSTH